MSKVLIMDASNVVSNVLDMTFPSGFELKKEGSVEPIVLGYEQGLVLDAAENITSVKTQLNLLLAACRSFGLIDTDESSSSSSSSESSSSSSSSVMGCCDTYDFEGATSDTASNGIYSFVAYYNSHPYYFNGSRYLFYSSADDKWLINITVSELSPKYYSDFTLADCPEGQYRWGGNDSLQGYMYCNEASSSSSSSDSSSSESSSSESSSTEWMSTSSDSSLYGCPSSVTGSSFSTYANANGIFSFVGYYGGRPKYQNSNGWYVQYESMDSRWSVATDMGVLRYYCPVTQDCPSYSPYKLTADNSDEGSIV